MKFANVLNDAVRASLCLIVSFAVLLTSCGGGSGSSGPSSPPLVQAMLFSFPNGSAPPYTSNALVNISDGSTGANITSASVTMNGVPFIYNGAPTHQDFEGNVLINPGDTVTLVVQLGGQTYTASTTQVTSYPTISSPASGATWSAISTNTVTWSGGAPLASTSFIVGVVDAADPFGKDAYVQNVATGATSLAIPAYYSITAGSRDVLVGLTTFVSIPNADPNSFLYLGGYNYVPITVPGMPVTSRTVPATNSLVGANNILNAVTWSGTQFVAVGGPGTVLTSPDGITWTSRTSGTGNALYGVAWSGTQFVAVGSGTGGIILTSPDGITWTSRTSGTQSFLSSVTWSGTRFVAVGSMGTILTSPDGITWTPHFSGTGNYLSSVTWSGAQFVVVGADAVLTSPDGITWTSRYASGGYLSGVTWSGTQFVAVGWTINLDTILTSPDGVTWTSRNSGTNAYPVAVIWSGTEFVAVGGTSNGGTILTSPDGITWTQQASGTKNYLNGVTWSGTELVMVGYENTILTSP